MLNWPWLNLMGLKTESEVMNLEKIQVRIGIWIGIGGQGPRKSNLNTLNTCMKLRNNKINQ